MQGMTWIWLWIFGSLFFFVGGLTNVVKVYTMQQIEGLKLEKLRGGAQERLSQEMEGQVPLIIEEQRIRRRQAEEAAKVVPGCPTPKPTPYKDVLVGQS
jgi:hypothetical protein